MKRAIFAIALLAAGCATPSPGINVPSAYGKGRLSGIKAGMTPSQLEAILGEPESKLSTPDGDTYFFKDVNLVSVWALFGQDGKLADWKVSE